jgi:23S rRNA pseudouridine2605 synthase
MEQVENKAADVLQKTVRINRFIAMAGVASRRKAEELILGGDVMVNKVVVTDLATKISPETDKVTVRGTTVHIEENLVYILLNKPNDYITTKKDERDRRTVYDLIDARERVFSVGRLDRKTTGVLLFTNDGELANCLMHPSHEVEKKYHVTLTESLEPKDILRVKKGVFLDDGKTAPAKVDFIPGTKNRDVLITIHEGKNRQVRRMFESLEYEVQRLDRVEYAGLTAAGLRRGGWRYLEKDEVRRLKKLAAVVHETRGSRTGRRRTPHAKTLRSNAPRQDADRTKDQ